jgi:peptide/nickel transport system substrate-binding protein
MKKAMVGVVVLVLVASACTGGSGGSGDGGGDGGGGDGGTVFLKIAASDFIDSMNPYVGQNDDSYSTYQYIYPYLNQLDSSLSYVPDFATSWEHSDDELTWTFHLVEGAKWSDGQPLTSKDVTFTYNTDIKYQDGPTGGAAGSIAHLIKVTAPDDHTVVFHYSQPVPTVLANVQQNAILPEHVWGQYATGDGKALKTFPNLPADGQPVVSGGPFMVTHFKPDEVALFERNPNYYGTAAKIDGFALQLFSNEDAEITAIQNGQLDAIESVPVTSVTTLQDAGIKVFIGPGLTERDFIINSNPDKTVHRELLNPQVKQAFEYAVDRAKIVETAWLGYAQPASALVPPATGTWHDPTIQPLPFDLAKANELLDQLGYQKGSDGIRVADGHPMAYDVLFPGSERGAGDRAFQIIQGDFEQIGVKLTQRPMGGGAVFSTMVADHYTKWDLAMWNWTPPIDPDFLLSVLTCGQYGDWSDSGYCNPAYDKLYVEQGQELDPQKRQQIVYQMQKMVAEDRPYIMLTYGQTIDAWSPKWAGFVQSVQGLFPFLSKESLTSVHPA